MKKLILILLAVGMTIISGTGVAFAGPKPPKSICLNLEGTDYHINIITKRGGIIKMSGGKVTLYNVQGFYQISSFVTAVKGSGYMKGNVFKFNMMGTDDYEGDLMGTTAFSGYWDVDSDLNPSNRWVTLQNASQPGDILDNFHLLEVSCRSLPNPIP